MKRLPGLAIYRAAATPGRRLAVRAGLLVALLAACGGAAAPSPASPAGSAATPASAAAKPGSAPAKPAASGLTHIKVGVVGITADAPLFIAQDMGYNKEQGLQADFTTFKTAADSIPAVSTGQLDAGSGAMAAGVFNAIARGATVRLVADKGQHSGSPINGFTSALVVAVPKGDAGKYKTFADMKGKSIAITATGSGGEVMFDKALATVGASSKDIDFKTMGFPEMATALGNHSVDMANIIEPFVALGQAKGLLDVRWKSEELYAGQQGGMLMYGPNISKDIGDRFMVAYVKGLRDYYDAFGQKKQNTARMIDILANNTPVKDKTLYAKMGYDYYDPDGYINSKAVAYDLDWYATHNYVKQKPDLSKVIDNSYVDYAISKLGKYKA